MPVAKQPASGRGKKSARQAEHQAIKDLVRDLPSLIMQDSDRTEIPVSQPPTRRQPVIVHSDPRQRRWVWIGVGLCTLAIGAFWILNIRAMVQHAFDGRSVEKEIARSAGQDLQALLNTAMINNEKINGPGASSTAQTATSTGPTEEQLRAALLAALVATSTPATTTLATTTN